MSPYKPLHRRRPFENLAIVVLTIAALAAPMPAQAQATRTPAAQQALPSPEEAFRTFLRRAHPFWARLTWADAQRNLEVLAIDGFPGDGPRGVRIAPDFVAAELSLAFGLKNSSLTARRAYLLDDHIVLRNMLLENDSGQLRADFAVFSRDALAVLGQYLRDQRPDAAAAQLAGEVVLNGARATSREFTGDRPGQQFSSTISADLLRFSGLSFGEGEDAPMLISGMTGAGLRGSARFSGAAEFSLGRLDYAGSIPDLTRAVMQRLKGGPQADAAAAPERTATIPQTDPAAADQLPADPPPIAHPFTLSFADLSYRASRDGLAPAIIDAGAGALRGSIEEGGAMQVAARLSGMRATTSVFAGTPLEDIAQDMARRAGRTHLNLDIALEAGLSDDAMRLNVACVTIPGLIDISTDIDLSVPGLEKLLTSGRGGRSGNALDLLFASRARALEIRLVDQGLNSVLTASGFPPLGELISSALLSRLEGQDGMRMMMLQTALAPVASILSGYDRDGSLALGARFGSETNLPVALVGFLQSAAPVTDAAFDASRCDAVPLPR